MPPITCNRLVTLCLVSFLVVVVFLGSLFGKSDRTIRRMKEATHISSSASPNLPSASFHSSISTLFDTIKHTSKSAAYVDAHGTSFNISRDAGWEEPLSGDVVIIDMDTRSPSGKNEIFGPNRLDWEAATGAEDDGMLSASFMNHFLYAQIHGYDYRFFKAESLEPKGLHNTWIKPFVIDKFLHHYKFVVFIDADATIQHLEIPLEWLFNRWGIGHNTSIAMPIDTKQILNDDRNASCDSKGKVTLNTGFIIAQSLPLTFDMMRAWKTCPEGKRYKGCDYWKQSWSHEQRAFSEYIRYDYNPDGNNIVEIPCDDAMGYPGLAKDHPHILSDCNGHFVRHHTIDKAMTKTSTDMAMLQTLTEIMQKTLRTNRQDYMLDEEKLRKQWFTS